MGEVIFALLKDSTRFFFFLLLVQPGLTMYVCLLVCVLSQVMRDTLHYRPQLTKDQFLSPGYAERKIIMTFDLLQLCQTKHHQLDGARTAQKRKRAVVHGSSSMNHYLAPGGHSVQEVAGVSSVWREAPESRLVAAESGGFSVSLPPSPPPSPLQTPSPTVVHGCPLLCGEGGLELTPCSTPLKSTRRPKEDRSGASTQHHNAEVCVQVVREPVLTASGGSDEDDKEEEIESDEVRTKMQHSREKQPQSSKGTVSYKIKIIIF